MVSGTPRTGKLLEELFPYSLARQPLVGGVPEEVHTCPLLDPCLLGYIFDDLLDVPLRVADSLPGSKQPPCLTIVGVKPKLVGER